MGADLQEECGTLSGFRFVGEDADGGVGKEAVDDAPASTHTRPQAFVAGPPSNGLGAMLAVATAAGWKPGERRHDPTSVAIFSPHEPQRPFCQVLCRDWALRFGTLRLEENYCKRPDRIVLDIIEPWAGFDTEESQSELSHDARFLTTAFAAARRELILLGHIPELLRPLPADAPLRRHVAALQPGGTIVEPFPTNQFKAAEDRYGPGLSFSSDDQAEKALIDDDIAAAPARPADRTGEHL